MAKSNPTPRMVAEFAETEAIIGLLGHIARRTRKPPPAVAPPEPEPPFEVVEQAPASAFIVYEPSAPDLHFETESPAIAPTPLPPPEPERFETPVPMQSFGQSFSWETVGEEAPRETTSRTVETTSRETTVPDDSVPQPVGALTLGEFFARVNWRNRPEDVQPLPRVGLPDPPRFEETVESVLTAFAWDDE